MKESDSLRLARIEQQMASLFQWSKSQDEWTKSHDQHDDIRFDKMFNFTRDELREIKETCQSTNDKVQTLWDKKNRQEGAFSLGKWVVGGVGGIVGALTTFITHK